MGVAATVWGWNRAGLGEIAGVGGLGEVVGREVVERVLVGGVWARRDR